MNKPKKGQAIQEAQGLVNFRAGQKEFLRAISRYRLLAFLARRQYGKTTTFASIALMKMMKRKNHTVIFGSAKLNLSREIVRKEAEIMQKALQHLAMQAADAEGLLQVVDEKGNVIDALSADDFAEVFEAQRLEFRYHHSNSVYSRTKVVALRPDTVGETGDLMCDEIGRIKNWDEVWEAVEPIVSSNKDFRLTLATTPPPDDSHFSYAQLVPPTGTEFTPNASGNWYKSEMGINVLRVDALDAWKDGVPVYDLEKGEPLSPEQHRLRSFDKDAWDRNYGVKFVVGGAGACGLVQMDAAQTRGLKDCRCFVIEEEWQFVEALAWLSVNLNENPMGLGLDLATTEKETSNPTSFSVVEGSGVEVIGRCTFVWKTKDPAIAKDRIRRIVRVINARPGGRARRLCIDATNERYFAMEVASMLAGEVPVELVIGGETIEIPGYDDPITMKAYLGSLLVDVLDNNHLTLPPGRYIKEDFRLVKRDRGSFVAETTSDGKHGDTFDSHKLGLWALRSKRGGALTTTETVKMGGNGQSSKFKPRRLPRKTLNAHAINVVVFPALAEAASLGAFPASAPLSRAALKGGLQSPAGACAGQIFAEFEHGESEFWREAA